MTKHVLMELIFICNRQKCSISNLLSAEVYFIFYTKDYEVHICPTVQSCPYYNGIQCNITIYNIMCKNTLVLCFMLKEIIKHIKITCLSK